MKIDKYHAAGCVRYLAKLAKAFAEKDESLGDVEDVENNLVDALKGLGVVEQEIVPWTTKDGVKVKQGDTVYHPSYYPSGCVMEDGEVKIAFYAWVSLAECYSTLELAQKAYGR